MQRGAFAAATANKKTDRSGNFDRLMPTYVNMSCGAPSGTRTRDTLIKSQGA